MVIADKLENMEGESSSENHYYHFGISSVCVSINYSLFITPFMPMNM